MNPRRDINAVTQHGVIGEHDVANMNPDPDSQFGVAGERGLNLTRAANCIESAVEARKGPVADLADQPSVEMRQDSAQQLAMGRERAHRQLFVAAHERGVTDDIAEHDRRQFARRICRQGIGRTRHWDPLFDSIGSKPGTPGYYSGVCRSAKPHCRL